MMNERIKELKEQSFGDYSDGYYWPFFEVELEKFAELIVEECINELSKWKKEPFPFDADLAIKVIKQHFGVEE
jgi:hypothetical protein